jgi:Flp pilus assembly protein TadD
LTSVRQALAEARAGAGDVIAAQGHREEATAEYRAALEAVESVLTASPKDARARELRGELRLRLERNGWRSGARRVNTVP